MRTLQRCARSLRKGDVLHHGPTWKPQASPIADIRKGNGKLTFKTQGGGFVVAYPDWKYTIQR
jgi:hypothetical protein